MNDPDGDLHWMACVPHAEAFHRFVKEQSERAGSAWSAVFTGISGDTAVVAVDGSD